MISAEEFYGNGLDQSIAADVTISSGNGRTRTISASVGGLKVKIEAFSNWRYHKGSDFFTIWNNGANAWTLAKSDGTAIVAVPAGDIVTLDINDTSGLGSYVARVRTPI